jgi:hypothetical protein
MLLCIHISQNEFKILKHSEDETKTNQTRIENMQHEGNFYRKRNKKVHQISLSHLSCGMAEKLWWVIPSRAEVRVAGMHCTPRVHG